MNSKLALKRLKQETTPTTYMVDFDKDECIEIIEKDLDRLEQLEKENEELKSIIKELSEKIAKDSAEMSSMNSELRKLKGGFIPQNYEVLGND